MKNFFAFVCFSLCFFVSAHFQTMAQSSSLRIIRDTEIEKALESWLSPLLEAAGMTSESVNLVLVESDQVNAFVAGGANIFLYTGLIEKTENPEELIGVMAHELGHITGGHLIRGREAMEHASYESILGAVLGLGTAVLSGNPQAGSAILRGGQGLATSGYLANSRVTESSADQAAFRFMDTAGMDTQSLITFLEKMESDEVLLDQHKAEYTRTHPLSRNRITALQTKVNSAANKDAPTPALWSEQHGRIKAKLAGFISPDRIAWTYDPTNKSIDAIYARAIAAYRKNNTTEALTLIDSLLTREPQNPYFMELKAQMLRDFGKVDESLPLYKAALEEIPQAALIRIDYARALIAANKNEEAIDALKIALKAEPRASNAHRLLATAYGKNGQDGMAKLHLAEEAVLKRDLTTAKLHANGAIQAFEEGDPAMIQARDLLRHIENIEASDTK